MDNQGYVKKKGLQLNLLPNYILSNFKNQSLTKFNFRVNQNQPQEKHHTQSTG